MRFSGFTLPICALLSFLAPALARAEKRTDVPGYSFSQLTRSGATDRYPRLSAERRPVIHGRGQQVAVTFDPGGTKDRYPAHRCRSAAARPASTVRMRVRDLLDIALLTRALDELGPGLVELRAPAHAWQ